jgi:cytochrome c oxidase accessory protein FixG
MNDKIQVKDVTKSYDLYKAHQKIYIRRIKGYFNSLRFSGNIVLFALFFGIPWITQANRQSVLFDLPARKFHIFNITFWPQDFILLSWFMIIAAFALFFVTVIAGRIWCGYTCPQSAWTWIFVWIEEKTEGKRNSRIKLDAESASVLKGLRKTAKHVLWLLVGFLTAATFVGYFYPIRELFVDIARLDLSGWSLFFIGFFTLATYGNAGWLREQVCIYMCPYARFQSVMFDKDTLIVSYDPARGEHRGRRRRGVDPSTIGLGDCIDCDLCVQVCPTGIDIRDGLQYECISCAACVDACDSVMDKMGYEPGLISYTTESNLLGVKTKFFRPRLIGYGITMIVIIAMFAVTLNQRIPLELDIIRDRDVLHRITAEGNIENRYNLKIMNMSHDDKEFILSASGLDNLTIVDAPQILIPAGGTLDFRIQLEAPTTAMNVPRKTIYLSVTEQPDTGIRVTEETRFFGPIY